MIWPAWIPVAVALLASAATSFDPMLGMLSLVLGVLVVCGWLISVLVATGIAAWRRAWRRTASLLAMLICAGPAMVVSTTAGDYIHLALALPYYTSKIAALDGLANPIYFPWPSAGLVPSYERYLVYDSSDELASHVSGRQPRKSEPAVTRTVRHLAGHFYLVEDFW